MRLFYFVYSTYQNTANKVVFEHANRLSQRGYDVQIITFLGRHPRWFDLKVPVRNIFYLFFLKKTDVAVATFWPTAYWVFLSRAGRKFYFVLGREVEFYTNIFLRRAVLWSLKLPLKKFTISRYLTRAVGGAKTIKFFALDTNIFRPSVKKISRVNPKKIHVLSVMSWYNRYKGPDRLLKVIQELKSRYPGKYTFSLVSLQDKPFAQVFDHFHSRISAKKLAQLYHQADLLLAPGRFETYFVPGLEAMACGCPVIATSSDGITEYAVHNKNAVIVKNLSDIWEKNIIGRVCSNKKLVKKLVKNGYATASQYKWSKIIDELEEMYFGSA